MDQLFGTDGIRGLAGEFPLDKASLQTIGASLASRFQEKLGRTPKFISGRDTRESGESIEEALHTGARSAGASIESAGVITTPGVAFLTRQFEFDAGVVVSASHNPYQDNGIKIFAPDGRKIDESTEKSIEADVYSNGGVPAPLVPVRSHRIDEFRSEYIHHLRTSANGFSCEGAKIVIDCANGAACGLAPELFSALGAEIVTIYDQPDGRNINLDCGSLHPEHLVESVTNTGADIGIAFDGDADRALFVDEKGNVVDGDATLWIMARYLQEHGELCSSTVVATVMSNIGLEIALASRDIKLIRTSVGDKYVLEKLLETRSEIGGEQSGHIIFPRISLVGDGMITALLLLRAIREKGVSLSQAVDGFQRYPQVLLNVKVREKRPFAEIEEVASAAADVEEELSTDGRLLLRYSGTENLARVMIEGKDQAAIESQAERLADVIKSVLG
ncbi:MAG: phosphoglucosamine mutase [Pyrinomonadaceae bacterium]